MRLFSALGTCLTVAVSVTLAACQSSPLNQENTVMINQDEAAIVGIVESVGVLADRGEFDALSRLFAPSFTLDYSSLNGQAASTKTPIELMSEWSSVLPGFDQTRHHVFNVVVTADALKATATADVVASHWVGALFWQVEGSYDYQLEKRQDQWMITLMRFNLANETGTREVFSPAIAAASEQWLPGNHQVIAQRNKATVRQFFQLLSEEKITELVRLFADEGEQINPYTGGIFPAGAKGKAALTDYWSPVPGNFDGMQFPITALWAGENPNQVFVEYRGEITLKEGAGIYENHYYSTFRFNSAGDIVEYVEIFDPVVAARGFGLLNQLK